MEKKKKKRDTCDKIIIKFKKNLFEVYMMKSNKILENDCN